MWRASTTAGVSAGAGPIRNGNHQLKVDNTATVSTTRLLSARKAMHYTARVAGSKLK